MPALAFRAAKRLLGPLIWRETYRCLTLPWDQARAQAAQTTAPTRGADVRLLEREDLRRYSRESAYEISAAFVDSIAGRDDLCSAPSLKANSRRTASSRCGRPRSTPTCAFTFLRGGSTHTRLPAWRGNRLHRELFVRSLPEVGRWLGGLEPPLGFVTLVRSDNRSSSAALRRLGFGPVDSFAVFRVRLRPRVIVPSRAQPEGFRIEVQ